MDKTYAYLILRKTYLSRWDRVRAREILYRERWYFLQDLKPKIWWFICLSNGVPLLLAGVGMLYKGFTLQSFFATALFIFLIALLQRRKFIRFDRKTLCKWKRASKDLSCFGDKESHELINLFLESVDGELCQLSPILPTEKVMIELAKKKVTQLEGLVDRSCSGITEVDLKKFRRCCRRLGLLGQ